MNDKNIPKYNLGDLVYLRTDKQKKERLITAILVRANGIEYELSFKTKKSIHYPVELSKEKQND